MLLKVFFFLFVKFRAELNVDIFNRGFYTRVGHAGFQRVRICLRRCARSNTEEPVFWIDCAKSSFGIELHPSDVIPYAFYLHKAKINILFKNKNHEIKQFTVKTK